MVLKKNTFTYINCLMKAGWNGARAAHPQSGRREVSNASIAFLLCPALLGTAIGAWNASFRKHGKSGREVAAAGFVGGAIGLGAGAVWVSRSQAVAVARAAIQSINAVRDAHWLEKHPIAYA